MSREKQQRAYTDLDGDSVTTTVGDGFQLGYSLHTVPGSSTTYRNIVANSPVLSKGGLEAAELLFATQMIDTNGQLVFYEPDTLITTNNPTVVNTAKQYLGSYADPESANAGVLNPYQGKYRHIVLPFLSTTAAGAYNSAKAQYWFLACLARKDAYCMVGQAPTLIPPTENDGKEFETMDKQLLSLLQEIVIEKFSKLQGTLKVIFETICSEIQQWRRSTTIMETSF